MEHIIIMAAIFITQRGKLKCCTAVLQDFKSYKNWEHDK